MRECFVCVFILADALHFHQTVEVVAAGIVGNGNAVACVGVKVVDVAVVVRAVGGGSYFSGSLTFPFGDMECRLTASVIVYRRRERLPEGDRDAIADLVPVWWEFHTVGSDGEALNDFSFSEVRALL